MVHWDYGKVAEEIDDVDVMIIQLIAGAIRIGRVTHDVRDVLCWWVAAGTLFSDAGAIRFGIFSIVGDLKDELEYRYMGLYYK